MATTKSSTDNAAHCDHEAILSGVIALATLYSHCVEAFGLIHPIHKWDKEEQILLARLGLQQARLLLWGDVLGVSSPPKSVTDRAIPKHPSSAYPDLDEPTFFGARDPRLDEPEIRTKIEKTLSAILDRPKHHTREEMMSIYGLKPPKRMSMPVEQALDLNRLEAFRERWELLQEVAESYAQLSTRRSSSILHSSWQVADTVKFAKFIALTQEKVDYLIELLDVKEAVDRGVRMDIRSFGWHIAPERARLLQDTSKLRLLREICQKDYPEYLRAVEQALEQISRETRENATAYNPYASAPKTNGTPATKQPEPQGRRRSSGFFGLFKKSEHSRKDSGLVPPDGPERSLSDSGPTTQQMMDEEEEEVPLGRIRSKSVGAWIDPPLDSINNDRELHERLKEMTVVEERHPSTGNAHDYPPVIRHDQYHGIARTNTKDLHQGDY